MYGKDFGHNVAATQLRVVVVHLSRALTHTATKMPARSAFSQKPLVSTSLTDGKGNFEIRELTKGNYRLSITAEDYQALDENIALTADKRVTYTLYPERNVELSGVEVVADRSADNVDLMMAQT